MPKLKRRRVFLEVSKKACLTQPSVSCSFKLYMHYKLLSFICVQVTGCGEATGYDTIDAVIAALQWC